MSAPIQAYLDDYNLINCRIRRNFNEGKAGKFVLLAGRESFPLFISDVFEEEDSVVYQLHCGDLEIGRPYQVVGPNGYTVPLIYRFIVKSERFNREFYYEGSDLGCSFDGENTSFKLWAPTSSEVTLCLENHYHKMIRREKGVYSQSFRGNLSGYRYHFLVRVNGQMLIANDPYSKASTPNSGESVVAFPMPLRKAEVEDKETVIYEVSVRDYSEEGTFNGMKSSLNYLVDLGVSHIQLLPVNDFGSVNDYHHDLSYNWGYDPVNYQVLEGSYSSNPDDPLLVIDEFGQLVQQMHLKGLKVNLDVVFNHVYHVESHPFHNTVPYYFFRYGYDEKLADGTYCGNEVDSEMSMARKYIIDTCTYYLQQFDVDGFRFDLMGMLDAQTVMQLKAQLESIKPQIMLYGEGWNMPSGMRGKACSMANYKETEGIGFFNDFFRDTLKGSTFDDEERGYGCGDVWKSEGMMEAIEDHRFGDSQRSINYVECHDNLTLMDKLAKCCREESPEQHVARLKLMSALVLLSQGVSFLHGGQEFALSKKGLHNNYNTGDDINKLSREKKDQHPEVIRYIKDVITLKNRYHIGHNENVSTLDDEGVIFYEVNDLLIIVNPTTKAREYTISSDMKLLLDEYGLADGPISKQWTIEPLSLLVLGSGANDQ